MISPVLSQVEELINHLPYQERLWLIERLAQQLQTTALPQPPPDSQPQIVLMAANSRTQAELREAGDRLLRQAEAQHEQSVRTWDEAMVAMGISGQPIGAAALRQMMIADGINPEDNEFSRGIIEMREE